MQDSKLNDNPNEVQSEQDEKNEADYMVKTNCGSANEHYDDGGGDGMTGAHADPMGPPPKNLSPFPSILRRRLVLAELVHKVFL